MPENQSAATTDTEFCLTKKAQSVNLDKIGSDSTYAIPSMFEMDPLDPMDTQDKKRNYDTMRTYVAAQVIYDNISNSEKGIALRWLMPDLDLCDGLGYLVKQREWTVPANGMTFEPQQEYVMPAAIPPRFGNRDKPTEYELITYKKYIERYEELAKAMREAAEYGTSPHQRHRQTVFRTGINSRNDKKVILLFGFGVGYDSNHIITSAIVKSVHSTKAHVSLSHLKDGEVAVTGQPLILRRNQDIEIKVTYANDGWKNKKDKLIVYGIVGEAMGSHQM
jgi:hypothetical protein